MAKTDTKKQTKSSSTKAKKTDNKEGGKSKTAKEEVKKEVKKEAQKKTSADKETKKKTTKKTSTKEVKAKKEKKADKKAEKKELKAKTEKAPKETKAEESAKEIDGDELSMADLLSMSEYQLRVPKRGDVVEGVITDLNKRMVLVDIGAKTEGMVVEQEFDATKELIGDLHVGDKVAVYVTSPENERGQILLSLKRAAIDRKWEQFEEYMETGKVLKVSGIEVNRGGLIVSAEGLRGFVPSSQFGKNYLGRMDVLLEKDFEVKVIEVDKEKNRLIFSEREVSEAEAIENKNKALDVIDVGGIFEGVVSGIMPFGVFVTVTVPLGGKESKDDIGQVEGLVHISEISWEKVNDPNDYFTQGDKVKVKVLGIDNGKLNLSVKQLSGDPWETVSDKYEVGTSVTGKVTRVEPFGVFVTLEPGVDGLIHISKIEAGKEPEVGRDIDVVVDSVDLENRRMSLGLVLTEVPVMYK